MITELAPQAKFWKKIMCFTLFLPKNSVKIEKNLISCKDNITSKCLFLLAINLQSVKNIADKTYQQPITE